jgi:hypothetical protein
MKLYVIVVKTIAIHPVEEILQPIIVPSTHFIAPETKLTAKESIGTYFLNNGTIFTIPVIIPILLGGVTPI